MNQLPHTFKFASPVLALFVVVILGCGSSATKDSPANSNSSAQAGKGGGAPAVEPDNAPADPISIEEFHKEKAVEKHVGKRVTWKCVVETVDSFGASSGFVATGFPIEFEGLKEPKEDKEHLGEYSNKYNEYAKKEIERVGQIVTFYFEDRESYDKLKGAIGKHATISGIVHAGPINNTADLKRSKVVSLDN